MTPQEIREIVQGVVADKLFVDYWYFVAVVVVAGLAGFFGAYLSTKGKNLATKEDIGGITREIEAIKLAYAERLKSAENAFVLSATSHLAEKAFDKHVEFCEKYIGKVNEALGILFREGPTQKALVIAGELYLIRREFVLWETKEVGSFLDRFEQALREMGADEGLLPHLAPGKERSQLVDKIYDTFKEITTLESLPDGATPEIATTRIIRVFQDHLGVSELTDLRRHYLSEASRRIR